MDLGGLLADRVDEPAVVVGHSLGTILALRLWHTHPERVRALVFVGGLPEARPAIRERLAQRAGAVAAAGLAGWGCCAGSSHRCVRVSRYEHAASLFTRAAGRVPPGADR